MSASILNLWHEAPVFFHRSLAGYYLGQPSVTAIFDQRRRSISQLHIPAMAVPEVLGDQGGLHQYRRHILLFARYIMSAGGYTLGILVILLA